MAIKNNPIIPPTAYKPGCPNFPANSIAIITPPNNSAITSAIIAIIEKYEDVKNVRHPLSFAIALPRILVVIIVLLSLSSFFSPKELIVT